MINDHLWWSYYVWPFWQHLNHLTVYFFISWFFTQHPIAGNIRTNLRHSNQKISQMSTSTVGFIQVSVSVNLYCDWLLWILVLYHWYYSKSLIYRIISMIRVHCVPMYRAKGYLKSEINTFNKSAKSRLMYSKFLYDNIETVNQLVVLELNHLSWVYVSMFLINKL